jgi:hypothetical protein
MTDVISKYIEVHSIKEDVHVSSGFEEIENPFERRGLATMIWATTRLS